MQYVVRGSVVRGIVTLAVLLLISPGLLLAGLFDKCCCKKCRLPRPKCCCTMFIPEAQPVCPAPQVTLQPVIETKYRQQPVLTTKTITETRFRMEQYTENVPVTHTKTVCVDEGSYQQVWVPKVVAKQVAETVMQTRVGCRQVPFQVNRQVAECTLQTVPYQSVRYVPTVTPANSMGYPSVPFYQEGTPGMSPATSPLPAAPQFPSAPTLMNPEPVPSPAASSSPSASGNTGLVPVPSDAFSTGAAQPILPRGATPISRREPTLAIPTSASSLPSPATPIGPRLGQPIPEESSRNGHDNHHQGQKNNGAFLPAPSAAMVWRTQQGQTTR